MIAWLIRGLLAAALVGAVILGYTTWRDSIYDDGHTAGEAKVQAQWNADTIKRQAAATTAINKARKEEQDAAAAAMKVVRNELEHEKLKNASVARTAAAAGGLSRDIAALNAAARGRGLPTAAACPAEFARERDAAITARSLLGACTTEYRAVAEAADGTQLKLTTALGYIGIVAPSTAP